MRAMIVLVSACWSGTPTSPVTSVPVAGTCKIRELDLATQEPVKLRMRGKTFTNLSGQLARLEVIVAGKGARALVETELVEIEGDLDLAELPVRPSVVELRDGWLEITRGIAHEARGDALRFDVALPDGLAPKSLAFEIKCKELTFSEPPEVPDLGDDARVEVMPGAVARLRASPAGPVIANARAKAADGEVRESYVLERRGAQMRVRFSRPNAVVAWVDASSMRAHEGTVYGGLMGSLTGGVPSTLRCPQAVPLYVRIEEEVVRVGQIKAGVVFEPSQYRRHAVEIDLGSETELSPFVKPEDVKRCPTG